MIAIKRILTRKSPLKFGKYSECTVQQILDFGKKSYLQWTYFSLSCIDFLPEILEELHIKGEYLLSKPGKNEELFKKFKEEKDLHTLGFTKFKREKRCRRIRRAKFISFKIKDGKHYSKENLTWKNQGH